MRLATEDWRGLAAPPLRSPPSACSRSWVVGFQIYEGLETAHLWERAGVNMWVKIRTDADERAAWFAKAEAKGLTFSAFARAAISGAKVRRRTQLRRVDPDLLRQLALLGNNINQLARWANRDQRYADRLAILTELVKIERQLAMVRQSHEARHAD